MKFSIKIVLFLCFIILVSGSLQGQGFLHVKEKAIVNGKDENVILRGMGLGGWMLQEGYMLRVQKIGQQQHVIKKNMEVLIGKEKTAEIYDAWLMNHTRKIDVDSMAAWGFNSVRLPMHFNLYTLPIEEEPEAGRNTWLEKGFAMTDSLLNWCKANKMYLILDLHAAPGGQGNDLNIADRDTSKASLWASEANQQKMIALWKRIAERYENEPWLGAYDIINEPNFGFESKKDRNGCGEKKNEPLKKLMMDVTAAIRSADKNHIIIIEGNCWGNNYNGVLPPWDKNMVLSFHKYWNYNDANSIQGILNLRDQYNIPVWLGESGENSNVWFRDAIHLVEANNIGWAWWPLKKLGYNNPLEVRTPIGYQGVLDFWAGKSAQPSAEDAYAGLKELTDNLKLENCIYHQDVVDAMFRQVKTNDVIPFKKNTVGANTIVNAVDYDLGRNRFAYFDKDTANYYISTGKERTSGNRGHIYRNDGVDIEPVKEAGIEGYYISHFETGEWLQYTVLVEKKGVYTLNVEVLSNSPDKKLSVTVNKTITKKGIAIPSSAGKWQIIALPGITLDKGKNVIRISADAGEFDFKSIQIVSTGKK